jgi:hypothetical protein
MPNFLLWNQFRNPSAWLVQSPLKLIRCKLLVFILAPSISSLFFSSLTLGSFPKYSRAPPEDTASVLSASVPSSSHSHGRKSPGSPCTQRSKLKKLLDKLKEDQPSTSLFITGSQSFDNFDSSVEDG